MDDVRLTTVRKAPDSQASDMPSAATDNPISAPENNSQHCDFVEYDGRIILMDDIPEEYRDIAELLGMRSFMDLLGLCGGLSLYLPKADSIYRNPRDREIRMRFDGGNYKSLAVQFRMSERQIRKIIKGYRT